MYKGNLHVCINSKIFRKIPQKCIFYQFEDLNFKHSLFSVYHGATPWSHWAKQTLKKLNLWGKAAVDKSAWIKARSRSDTLCKMNFLVVTQSFPFMPKPSSFEKCLEIISLNNKLFIPCCNTPFTLCAYSMRVSMCNNVKFLKLVSIIARFENKHFLLRKITVLIKIGHWK